MKKLIIILIILILSGCAGDASLFAGADKTGYLDTNAGNAMFDWVGGMDIDQEGNIYVADLGNNVIRKVTPEGKVSTFAGTDKKGDKVGKKEDAEFNFPVDAKFDNKGNLFIADELNNKVKKIDKEGNVSNIELQGKYEHPTEILFGENNEFYINFEGNVYEVLPDLELEYIDMKIPDGSLIGFNKKTNEIYFKVVKNIPCMPSFLFLVPCHPPDIKIYTLKIGDSKPEDITEKYTKKPYPESNPLSIIFDDEGNMYISYSNSQISKTSKDGKFIRNYSTNNMRIFSMLIDNKRKILYYGNDYSIYKININEEKNI